MSWDKSEVAQEQAFESTYPKMRRKINWWVGLGHLFMFFFIG